MSTNQNSREVVAVGGKMIERLEYKGQPVVTFKMVDDLHGTTGSRMQFNRNQKHFVDGKDYFVTDSYEARSLGITAPNGLNVLTESGYLKLVKTFTDDLAWEVQGQLIECYFHRRHAVAVTQPLAPASNLALAELMLAELKHQSELTRQNTSDIAEIKATRRAEPYQYKMIQDAVHAKAKWFMDNHEVPYAKGISKTWTLLKNRFEVPTYQMIVASQVDDAVAFVNSLKLGHLATV